MELGRGAAEAPPQLGRSRAGASQTQLQFSRNAPALPENLAACYASPRPIIIEKLKQSLELQSPVAGDGLDSVGSVPFLAVSEEKLNWAVQLAKRDVKRRHLEDQVRQHLSREHRAPSTNPCVAKQYSEKEPRSVAVPTASKAHTKPDQTSGVEGSYSGARVYLSTPHRDKSTLTVSNSPPTRDPGPGPQRGLQQKEERSAVEVRRLQKELQSYIQKMEELARKERSEELLDPAEELRAQVWRQGQEVRSARMLYMLQQQVKEIQEDLEKLSPQKIKHTKKSQAMARLAAAHRGAVRTLQGFVAHLADPLKQQPASAHCRELGHIIRQLSLCSARLEANSAVPDVVADLLLQIEDLEVLLSKKGKKRPISASRVEPVVGSSRLPQREKKVRVPEPQKPLVARRLLPDEPGVSEESLALHNRCSPTRAAAAQEGWPEVEPEAPRPVRQQALGRSRPVKTEFGRGSGPPRKRGVLALRPQGSCRSRSTKATPAQPAHFQESTVAFRLKETKPFLQANRSPRGPAQPTSPVASPHRRQAGRGFRSRELVLEHERMAGAGPAAPGRDAARDKDASPARIAEQVEKAVRARLEPLLANAQKVNLSLERNLGLKEHQVAPPEEVGKAVEAAADDIPGTLLEDPVLEQFQRAEQEANLEAMLQRMKEIECFQEDVRRRYNQILYSDPEFWAQAERKEREDAARVQEPQTPRPIQVTKPEDHKEPHVVIVLERPQDANAAEEEVEERSDPGSRTLQLSATCAPQAEGGTFISVPQHVLQSVRDYGARYEKHLQRLSHEEVGSFNPWLIAQSLAEELAEEAVGDVATELRSLCEEYAEAVFTSEFLQAAE